MLLQLPSGVHAALHLPAEIGPVHPVGLARSAAAKSVDPLNSPTWPSQFMPNVASWRDRLRPPSARRGFGSTER